LPLGAEPLAGPGRPLRGCRPALFLVGIALLVGAVAYSKFLLPHGVAAVVNGEEISRSEFESAVTRARLVIEDQHGPAFFSEERGTAELQRLRYEVLSGMIRERVALQEARKAGIVVNDDEVAAAVAALRSHWGPDSAKFRAAVLARYGDEETFERAITAGLIIDRFMTEHVARGISDPLAVQAAAAKWMQDAPARAAVRVALAEQWSGPGGCGCCGRGPAGDAAALRTAGPVAPQAGERRAAPPADGKSEAAAKGLDYWREKHGDDAVTARVRDLGCHMEIDIIKNEKVVGSLRHQRGQITEM
jgi:hypothetical protein